MPEFTVEEMEGANTPPTCRIDGRVHVGRLHSAPEWFAWNERIQDLRARAEKGEVTYKEMLAFYRDYFVDLFPRSLFRRDRDGKWIAPWAPDVADTLMRQPLSEIEEAFDRFFYRQAWANNVRILTTRTPTPGTDSSPRTHGIEPLAAQGA